MKTVLRTFGVALLLGILGMVGYTCGLYFEDPRFVQVSNILIVMSVGILVLLLITGVLAFIIRGGE